MINVKKDLQLMGFTARKRSLSHLYLSLDNKEFAFLGVVMAILTGRFSFKRTNCVYCVANTKEECFWITVVCYIILNSLYSEDSVSNKKVNSSSEKS